MSVGTLSRADRRLVLGAAAALALAMCESTSFNYVLPALTDDFGATERETTLLRLVPDIGALLVVFLAGAIGRRWGERRVMLVALVGFLAGAVATTLAVGMSMATVGVLVMAVARSTLFVVGFGLVSARITGAEARASAFAMTGAILPLAYLLGPVVAGALLDAGGWRAVGAMWIGTGMIAMVLVAVLLPRSPGTGESAELVTPLLAGVFLAALVEALNSLGYHQLSVQLIPEVLVALVAFAALLVALRRVRTPSLALGTLRHGGFLLLLVVVAVGNFHNLFFYINMTFQLVFDLTPFETALVMVPTQIACITCAALTGLLVQRLGLTRAGVLALMALGFVLLGSTLISGDNPLWVPATVVAIYGGFTAACGVILTNAVMDSAPPGQDGGASAFRSAAGNVGSAISTALMTAVVFTAVSASLTAGLAERGLSEERAVAAVEELRDGATDSQIVNTYGAPANLTVADVSEGVRDSFTVGLAAHGLVGGALAFAMAGVFYVARRRQESVDASP